MYRRFLPSLVRKLSSQAKFEKNPVDTLRSRLYYQSKKRGILENDIVLGGFADKELKSLTENELHAYDKIINGGHVEWDLYHYLAGKKELPSDLLDNPVFNRMSDFVKQLKE